MSNASKTETIETAQLTCTCLCGCGRSETFRSDASLVLEPVYEEGYFSHLFVTLPVSLPDFHSAIKVRVDGSNFVAGFPHLLYTGVGRVWLTRPDRNGDHYAMRSTA